MNVREFVTQSYQLISANSPTVPLHGSDLSLGITILNQLLQSYASTGLMLTIAKEVSIPIIAGQKTVTCGDANFTPTPDITEGRLANLNNAWIELNGVTYPLIDESRNQFFAAFKYEPLLGLPRFIIALPNTQITTLRLYPAPSQQYEFHIRGKFQLPALTSNSEMDLVPQYYHLYLLFALAKKIALFKGRAAAWTPELEATYQVEEDKIIAASDINVAITGENASLLNGAYRVQAGV